MVHNPSLRQEPRNVRAAVIPIQREASILDWLESSGRLLARDTTDIDYREEEEEINALMAGDDNSFNDDDDDTDLDLED
ncbi:DUF3134 domain-containing protein [Myxacorys almedinensis]|uniref:DUF3134 domain-containing protein n=1 Tax=Myxacorys almedinensis A TaxID=2690445 RepID=A0A8J7YYN7_9CYAN|nr:DUF3134 domain-containing protein [Myxacorys almedinensis]NDJ17037.1 DUF3134 domain-containing protein [Myxacorys almedinensis A]